MREAGRVWDGTHLIHQEKLLLPAVSICPETTTALCGWDAIKFLISARLRFVSVINEEIVLFDVRRARWRCWLRCISEMQ